MKPAARPQPIAPDPAFDAMSDAFAELDRLKLLQHMAYAAALASDAGSIRAGQRDRFKLAMDVMRAEDAFRRAYAAWVG